MAHVDGKDSGPDGEISADDTNILNKESQTGTVFFSTDNKEFRESETSLEEDELRSKEDFNPAQCLFCNDIESSFDDNLAHMIKRHGLFIPYKNNLAVDLETLIAYFHLIIFTYF